MILGYMAEKANVHISKVAQEGKLTYELFFTFVYTAYAKYNNVYD